MKRKNPAAVALGRKGGSVTSRAKAEAARANGSKGGRPRKVRRPTPRPSVVIEKHWDGNECETEGANGRIYLSRGRWQWVLVVDGQVHSAHDRRRDARHCADHLVDVVR